MRRTLRAFALCSVPLLASCASWSGIPEPFDQLSGPFWKESHGVTVAADESALVVDMSGPHPCMIAYDADLDETEYMAHHIGSIAFAAQGKLALWSSISRTSILVPPDMDVVHSVEVPRFFGSNAVIVADPLAHRWVAISRAYPSVVVIVDADTGRVTHQWDHEFDYPRAAVIDAETGLLAVIEERCISLVHPESGELVHRLDVFEQQFGYDVAASGGRVWIASAGSTGEVTEFDVESGTVRRRIETGLRGDVLVACSPSRTHLAMLVRQRVPDAPDPCRITIFQVEVDGLTPLHTLETELPTTAHDIALMSRAQILLVACGDAGTLAWRYGEAD